MTTSSILTNMESSISLSATFEELASVGSSWVSKMEDIVKIHNNTPKNLTKITPKEVHFMEVKNF